MILFCKLLSEFDVTFCRIVSFGVRKTFQLDFCDITLFVTSIEVAFVQNTSI